MSDPKAEETLYARAKKLAAEVGISRQGAHRRLLKEAGICVQCTTEKATNGVRCKACADKLHAYDKARKLKLTIS